MSTKVYVAIIIILAIVIVVLAWLLWVTPAAAPTIPAPTHTTSTTSNPKPTTTTPASTSSMPLDRSVTVTSPKENATVAQTFTVSGTAPGAWFDEATFPIQVRDADDNLVGRVGANAQGNWETSGLVAFTATMNVDPSFHGPATLILNRDNPSGLPQNDDSVTVDIVVK